MMDWTPPPDPPAIIWQAKKKGGSRSSTDNTAPSSRTALYVGLVVILSDGTPCQITAIDPTGQAYCVPLPD